MQAGHRPTPWDPSHAWAWMGKSPRKLHGLNVRLQSHTYQVASVAISSQSILQGVPHMRSITSQKIGGQWVACDFWTFMRITWFLAETWIHNLPWRYWAVGCMWHTAPWVSSYTPCFTEPKIYLATHEGGASLLSDDFMISICNLRRMDR